MNAGSVLRFVPAGLALFDSIAHVIPLPTSYALFIKLPTAVICLAIALLPSWPSERSRPIVLVGAAAAFAVFLAVKPSFLFHHPVYDREGEFEAIGLWMTPGAR